MTDRIIQIILVIYATLATIGYIKTREELSSCKRALQEFISPVVPQPDTARIYMTEHTKRETIVKTKIKRDTVILLKRDTVWVLSKDTTLHNTYTLLNMFKLYEYIERKRDSIYSSLSFEIINRPRFTIDVYDMGDKIRFQAFVNNPLLADLVEFQYRYSVNSRYWIWAGLGVSYPLSPAVQLSVLYKFSNMFTIQASGRYLSLTYSRFIKW